MADNEQIVTLERLRDELVVVSQRIKKGEISPSVGNAVIKGLRASAYVEQIRLQRDKIIDIKKADAGAVTELSQDTKDKLDEIAQLMKKTKKNGGRRKNDSKSSK